MTDRWVLEVIHGSFLIKLLATPTHKPSSQFLFRDYSYEEILHQQVTLGSPRKIFSTSRKGVLLPLLFDFQKEWRMEANSLTECIHPKDKVLHDLFGINNSLRRGGQMVCGTRHERHILSYRHSTIPPEVHEFPLQSRPLPIQSPPFWTNHSTQCLYQKFFFPVVAAWMRRKGFAVFLYFTDLASDEQILLSPVGKPSPAQSTALPRCLHQP